MTTAPAATLVANNDASSLATFVYAYRFGCDCNHFKEILNAGATAVVPTVFANMPNFFKRPSMYHVLQIQRPSIINQLMYTQSQQIPLKTGDFYTN